MDGLTEHGVQGADLFVAEVEADLVGDAQPVQTGHVTGAIFGRVPVVGAVLVDHLQADETPVDVVLAQLLDLGDPTGGDPGPRANRIEKELEISHAFEPTGDLRSVDHQPTVARGPCSPPDDLGATPTSPRLVPEYLWRPDQ